MMFRLALALADRHPRLSGKEKEDLHRLALLERIAWKARLRKDYTITFFAILILMAFFVITIAGAITGNSAGSEEELTKEELEDSRVMDLGAGFVLFLLFGGLVFSVISNPSEELFFADIITAAPISKRAQRIYPLLKQYSLKGTLILSTTLLFCLVVSRAREDLSGLELLAIFVRALILLTLVGSLMASFFRGSDTGSPWSGIALEFTHPFLLGLLITTSALAALDFALRGNLEQGLGYIMGNLVIYHLFALLFVGLVLFLGGGLPFPLMALIMFLAALAVVHLELGNYRYRLQIVREGKPDRFTSYKRRYSDEDYVELEVQEFLEHLETLEHYGEELSFSYHFSQTVTEEDWEDYERAEEIFEDLQNEGFIELEDGLEEAVLNLLDLLDSLDHYGMELTVMGSFPDRVTIEDWDNFTWAASIFYQLLKEEGLIELEEHYEDEFHDPAFKKDRGEEYLEKAEKRENGIAGFFPEPVKGTPWEQFLARQKKRFPKTNFIDSAKEFLPQAMLGGMAFFLGVLLPLIAPFIVALCILFLFASEYQIFKTRFADSWKIDPLARLVPEAPKRTVTFFMSWLDSRLSTRYENAYLKIIIPFALAFLIPFQSPFSPAYHHPDIVNALVILTILPFLLAAINYTLFLKLEDPGVNTWARELRTGFVGYMVTLFLAYLMAVSLKFDFLGNFVLSWLAHVTISLLALYCSRSLLRAYLLDHLHGGRLRKRAFTPPAGWTRDVRNSVMGVLLVLVLLAGIYFSPVEADLREEGAFELDVDFHQGPVPEENVLLVGEDRIMANETLWLNENLVIARGTTIIENSSLVFANSVPGELGIYVLEEAKLVINYSNLTSNSSFVFEVYGELDILNSELSRLWGDRNQGDVQAALEIYTPREKTARIRNSTIFNCTTNGIMAADSRPEILNSSIHHVGGDALEMTFSRPTIKDCHIHNASVGIYLLDCGGLVENTTVEDVKTKCFHHPRSNTIDRDNTFREPKRQGLEDHISVLTLNLIFFFILVPFILYRMKDEIRSYFELRKQEQIRGEKERGRQKEGETGT